MSRFAVHCQRVAREYAARQVEIATMHGPRLRVLKSLQKLCGDNGPCAVSQKVCLACVAGRRDVSVSTAAVLVQQPTPPGLHIFATGVVSVLTQGRWSGPMVRCFEATPWLSPLAAAAVSALGSEIRTGTSGSDRQVAKCVATTACSHLMLSMKLNLTCLFTQPCRAV